jgi:hypothetical protein
MPNAIQFGILSENISKRFFDSFWIPFGDYRRERFHSFLDFNRFEEFGALRGGNSIY